MSFVLDIDIGPVPTLLSYRLKVHVEVSSSIAKYSTMQFLLSGRFVETIVAIVNISMMFTFMFVCRNCPYTM